MPLTKQELNQINHGIIGMVKCKFGSEYVAPVERVLSYLSTFCDEAYIAFKDGKSELHSRNEPAAPPEEKPIKDSSPL